MIKVDCIAKSFKLYRKPSDRLKEIVLRKPFHHRFQALQNISFEVADGATLGIIGRNGAGKSTLLKILNGVLIPDSGTIYNRGRITGLLELGTGFDPALTGLQNIETNGLLLGMSAKEITGKTQSIIDFSELDDFIHEPLRTYSSGMTMRLAFSIAIHADPDAFLVDEALSVGDGKFQQKCMRRIREFRAAGGSIIFVSHDLNAVKMLCDSVIVLDHGKMAIHDKPEKAVNHYNQLLAGDLDEGAGKSGIGGYGNFQAVIEEIKIRGVDSGVDTLSSGEQMLLTLKIKGHKTLPELSLGIMIRDRFGQDMYGTNSFLLGQSIALDAGEGITLRFKMPMNLIPGKYTVTLALHEGIDHTRQCFHWWDNASQFEVSGVRGPEFSGLFNLQAQLERL